MMPHGRSKYIHDDCRCEVCSKAQREYTAGRKAARLAYVQENGLPSSVEHGYSTYANWGCRCDVCRAAWSKYTSKRAKAVRYAKAARA